MAISARRLAGRQRHDLLLRDRANSRGHGLVRAPRAGLVAPDETTFAYLKGRPYAPKGAAWEQAVAYWRTLPSDPGATYDKKAHLDAADIAPQPSR